MQRHTYGRTKKPMCISTCIRIHSVHNVDTEWQIAKKWNDAGGGYYQKCYGVGEIGVVIPALFIQVEAEVVCWCVSVQSELNESASLFTFPKHSICKYDSPLHPTHLMLGTYGMYAIHICTLTTPSARIVSVRALTAKWFCIKRRHFRANAILVFGRQSQTGSDTILPRKWYAP